MWRLALILVTLAGPACRDDEPTRPEVLGGVYVLQ